ncbi:MAG TPA: hypothetical protein PLI09_19710 [Candidatus Hydrogenedentes bacterium]|nr:hypothetical protein [Candidatus Hydrogenedentota bacterium]
MNESGEKSVTSRIFWWLLGVWIFGVALAFFIRFSFVFYHENQEAIRALLKTWFS